MISRHVIYCDHYPDGAGEAGSNARERKPATVSHEFTTGCWDTLIALGHSKGDLPLGGIFRTERHFLTNGRRVGVKRQKKISLREENFA